MKTFEHDWSDSTILGGSRMTSSKPLLRVNQKACAVAVLDPDEFERLVEAVASRVIEKQNDIDMRRVEGLWKPFIDAAAKGKARREEASKTASSPTTGA